MEDYEELRAKLLFYVGKDKTTLETIDAVLERLALTGMIFAAMKLVKEEA